MNFIILIIAIYILAVLSFFMLFELNNYEVTITVNDEKTVLTGVKKHFAYFLASLLWPKVVVNSLKRKRRILMSKAKIILLKIIGIVIFAILTGVLASVFEDYRFRTFITTFYGYFSCYILNYEKFKNNQ